MQDRYVGDVGDFGKYGLLRYLMRTSGHRRMGVVWYLAPPEANGDGRYLGYLRNPRDFRDCDPVLFDRLRTLVRAGTRSVAAVRESEIFACDTAFYERLACPEIDPGSGPAAVAARRSHRNQWVAEARATVAGCDLVFIDPDNGIGGRSFRPHGKRGHKHAAWDEVRQFAADGTRSMVIYHHTGRLGSAAEQARRLVADCRTAMPHVQGITALGFRRGSHRILLIVPAAGYAAELRENVATFQKLWRKHYILFAD
jgi:hypothetical protein